MTLPRIQKHFPESKTHPRIQNNFGFWDVFCILGSVFTFWEVFWILEPVLDSGMYFGLWGVFSFVGSVLDSGKCLSLWATVNLAFTSDFCKNHSYPCVPCVPVFDAPQPCPTCTILDVPKSQSPHTCVPLLQSQFYTQPLISYVHGCDKV